jgi:hypothetical protein
MIISVINFSNGLLSDKEILPVLRAINRQVKEDFEPYWSLGATLRLEGHTGSKPDSESAADMRGDAVIYIWDKHDIDDAVGYHEKNNAGIPYGFVFLDIAAEVGDPWSCTLSHEALELIADPEVNLLVAGPHPSPNLKRHVFHWYEMCDAVQADNYVIDGVTVSDFVLPLYFTGGDEYTGRNDFLGSPKLKSFSTNPGGYIGFYDPKLQKSGSFEADTEAERRAKIKSQLKDRTRRGLRYKKTVEK